MVRVLVVMENLIVGIGIFNIVVSVFVFVVCVIILIGLCIGFVLYKIFYDDLELDVEKLKLRNVGEMFSSNFLIKRSFFRFMFLRFVSCKDVRY